MSQAIETTEQFDTTTPAFGRVTRFVQADWQRYGNWLARRVALRWPTINERHVPQLLSGYMNANDSVMFKTVEAVGLFRLVRKPFQPLNVESVFVFTNGKECHRQALWIVREAEKWGLLHGAARLYPDIASDMTVTEIKKLMICEEEKVLYRELGDKKHDSRKSD